MYALTLWQPWAHLVASGEKRIENRPWEPPAWLVGSRFAIHAGKHWDQDAANLIWKETGKELGKGDVVFGAIIATAKLVAVATCGDQAARLAGEDQGIWFFGPYGWVLEDIRPVDPPIECRGYQKLWSVGETLSEVLELSSRRNHDRSTRLFPDSAPSA